MIAALHATATTVDRTTAEQVLELIDTLRPEWHHRAACHGKTDRFYPTHDRPADWTQVTAICAACPVHEPCRAVGRDEDHGVWGGVVRQRHNPRGRRLQVVMGDDTWTSAELAEVVGVTSRTILRRLAVLVERGEVERVPGGRDRHIVLADQYRRVK